MYTKSDAIDLIGKKCREKLYLVGANPAKGIGGLILTGYQLRDEIDAIRAECQRQHMTDRQISNRIKSYLNATPCTRSWTWGEPVYSYSGDYYYNIQKNLTLTNDITGDIIS
jgi:hypothetical protein